jgi:hypothetical protein
VKGTWWLTGWISGLVGYITYRAFGNIQYFLAHWHALNKDSNVTDTSKATIVPNAH